MLRSFISRASPIQTIAKRGLATGIPKTSPLWNLGRLNHVAIAVPDIDQSTLFYRDLLGAKVSEKV
ncbi:hypothetical protein BGZ46_010503, partial [Entomortierella lignicola]